MKRRRTSYIYGPPPGLAFSVRVFAVILFWLCEDESHLSYRFRGWDSFRILLERRAQEDTVAHACDGLHYHTQRWFGQH